jgi:hypothetical protein
LGPVDEDLLAVIRNKALVAVVLSAGLLMLQIARAEITEDFARSVAAAADAASADTDLRRIPGHAAEGVMFPPRGRLVAIDRRLMMLAPGSQIRNLKNRIVAPSTITSPVSVRYTLDSHAYVYQIWLMPGEVELPQKNAGNPSEN